MLINRYGMFDNIHKQVKTTTYTYQFICFLLVLHYINFAIIFEAYPMPIIFMILRQRCVNFHELPNHTHLCPVLSGLLWYQ